MQNTAILGNYYYFIFLCCACDMPSFGKEKNVVYAVNLFMNYFVFYKETCFIKFDRIQRVVSFSILHCLIVARFTNIATRDHLCFKVAKDRKRLRMWYNSFWQKLSLRS